jgi:hypothetical protein
MSNDLTPREPEIADDGFSGSLISGRLNKGTFCKWTDTSGWTDRDGLKLPSPSLVVAIDEALQKWKDNKPEVIRDKPLPNPNDLNAAIPQTEWERGKDGKIREPWAHIVIVYLVNPMTGEFYTFSTPNIGAHVAFELLKEAVITMRALRGTRVMPVVNLSERPWKTRFGMQKRPHFEIIGWKTPGDDGKAIPAAQPTPQLPGPATAPTSAPVTTTPAATVTSTSPPPRQSKPPVTINTETLNAVGEMKPVTAGEILKDEIPW